MDEYIYWFLTRNLDTKLIIVLVILFGIVVGGTVFGLILLSLIIN